MQTALRGKLLAVSALGARHYRVFWPPGFFLFFFVESLSANRHAAPEPWSLALESWRLCHVLLQLSVVLLLWKNDQPSISRGAYPGACVWLAEEARGWAAPLQGVAP